MLLDGIESAIKGEQVMLVAFLDIGGDTVLFENVEVALNQERVFAEVKRWNLQVLKSMQITGHTFRKL